MKKVFSFLLASLFCVAQTTVTTPVSISVGVGVPAISFGMDFNSWHISPPTDENGKVAAVKMCRNWDSGTKLGQINTAPGVYNWKNLDDWVAKANSLGCKILYTIGDTPAYMTGPPPNPSPCNAPAPTSCLMPTDVNKDGTGTDAMMIKAVTDIFKRYNGVFTAVELWNEPDCNCFFDGSTSQLVRITNDIATAARTYMPGVIVVSPSFHGPTMATKFDAYWKNGGTNFDVLDFHGRGSGVNPNSVAESFLVEYASVQNEMAKLKIVKPVYDGEWGILSGQITDPDLLQAFYGTGIVLRMASTIAQQYPYQWDSPSPYGFQGSLSGNAYDAVAFWLTGHTIAPCQLKGTIYNCVTSNGKVVWDTSKTCIKGVCTTSPYIAATYRKVVDLNSKTTTIQNGTIQLGKKPVLLQE